MSDVTRSGDGARRASEAVLHAGGGRAVTVLVPQPPEVGVVGEQLGLATPMLNAVELAPVLLREKTTAGANAEAAWEMLVPASRVEVLSGAGAPAVLAFFAMAAGVQVDGTVLRVSEVSTRDCAGVPYLYRVMLQMPSTGSI